MEKTRGTTKNHMGHIAHRTLAKAAVSFVCILAMVGGMIFESLPVPVAYSLESVLVCGKQEHVHNEGCWSRQLICAENHEHSEACYEKTLICGAEEHIHSTSCYAAVEAEPALTEETAAPEAQETPALTAEPELTPDATPAATNTPEVTSAATAAPELTLSNLTVSAAAAKVGETVRWVFECANADEIDWAIYDESGAHVIGGESGDERAVEWTAAAAGVYTMIVTAVRGETQAQLKSTVQIEAAASEALAVSAVPQQRYAFANKDALVFDTSVSGGTEPVSVEYEIRANGEAVYAHSGYEAQISYMPLEFGVHTLTMTATDANGQQARTECAVPVALEEREYASEWERTFAQLELTGNFAKDILAIAQTQLGYAESERNFIIDEDGVQHGYIRYGAWYGASYSEWCAMFVSFCAHYAQIPEEYLPIEANCAKWKQKLDDKYLDDEDSYTPEAGDLIFFHYNRDEDQKAESEQEKNVPNHVGIVTRTDGNYIYTIEGNSAARVRERSYALDDEHIVGYVSMAKIMQLANPDAPFGGAAFVRIEKTDVNLREQASLDCAVLGKADRGDLFQLDAPVVTESGEIWYRIFYGEGMAYVRSDLAAMYEATDNEPQPDANDALNAFERLTYEGETPEGMERLENGLFHYADAEGEIYLVYGRYGEGEAQLYLCDAEGNPFGEDAGFDAVTPYKSIQMNVTVETDTTVYLDKENNTVYLTIVIQATDKAAMLKNSTLTLTLDDDAVTELVADSISTNGGTFSDLNSSGNTITATAKDDIKQNTVTVKCHYTISDTACAGKRTITVTASDGKDARGSGNVSYEYRMTGVKVSALDAPRFAVGGENVNATVTLKNYDESENLVTKLVVEDKDGNAVYTQDMNLALADGVATDIPFAFAVPEGDYGQESYTIKATYADGQTALREFTIAAPTLTIKPVVDYDQSSKAVTVKLVCDNPVAGAQSYIWLSRDTRSDDAVQVKIGETDSALLVLTGDNLAALEAMGAESEKLLYYMQAVSNGEEIAMSNPAAFENLPQLIKAVEVVAKLAEHYNYAYSDFRALIDNLYYTEVAKDRGVPFSDANSLMLYLQSCYESSGIDGAVKAWEKYRYDLYDPHEWPTLQRKQDQGAKNPYPGRENIDPKYDFGDNRLGYEKDEKETPFHVNPASKVNAVDGQDEDYFGSLEKTAGAVENGDENTQRQYTIDLTAQAKNKVLVPAAMVFQIQTSWQMFDLEHANGVNGPKGSPCKVQSMATLYDIKHALIDFAEWLRENGDGSIVFAITDVEHAGTFNALNAPYFTNDSDTLIEALEGWDIFGNCEHVHYSQVAYTAAVNALSNKSNFTNWVYTPDGSNLYDYARKIAVVIGGSTENSNGTNGYGCVIAAGDSMQYVYTIRTNSGTGILSWLDNAGMTALTDARGYAYKNVDTRKKVFNTLVDIVKQFQMTEAARCVNDVTVSDVIADEFEYVADSARVVRIVDGAEVETRVKPTLTTETDEKGNKVTRLTYKFPDSDTTRPGETLHLRFDVQAKEDYIGSNNVYTNVGKATLSYTDSIMGTQSIEREFAETPQVNVPIRYSIEDGGETTVGVGTDVNLWSLGETIVKEMAGDTDGIEDWSVRYDQINGSVTYQWMKNVGTEENPIYEAVSAESSPVHVTNGVPDTAFAALDYAFSSEETGDFPFVLRTTFTPDDKSEAWSGVNDGAVNPLTKYGKVMVHVVKSTGIHVLKVAAETNEPLGGAVFTISQNGRALMFAKQADGGYAPSDTGSSTLTTGADGTLNIVGLLNGSYVLAEKSAPQGYAADRGSVSFTTLNGAMTQHSENGDHWHCDADALTITLENEVWIEPTPTPTPSREPLPTKPAEGNETSMTVRKVWTGDESDPSKRPQKITVQLQMNGVNCGEPVEVRANAKGEWVYTWENLPYKDEYGEVIHYSAVEDEAGEGMQWYDARYSDVETIPSEKAGTYWVEQSLSGMQNGESGTYAIYSSDKSGGWILKKADDPSTKSATSASLKTNQSHSGITYASELASAPDTAAQWTIIKSSNGYQIKNGDQYLTVDKKGNLFYSTSAGSAVWNLNSGKLSVTYTKDNKSETKWLKFDSGDKNKDNGKLSLGDQNNATSFTFYKQLVVKAKNDTYERQITNVYKNPNAKTKLVVQKVWANNSAYLHVNDTVTMQVYRKGEPMLDENGKPVTLALNAAGGWRAELTDLPLYEVIDESAGLMEKYVYGVYEEKIPNYTASGEGEATFVVTDESTGDGYYEATITNTRVKGEYTPTKPDTSANKRIDYLGDGGENADTSLRGEDDYRLYLDFTGASEPIDVLFVIDTTGSMTNGMGSGDSTPRQTVINNLMNGTNGNMGYLDQVATMNPENNVAVMLFSGPEYGSTANGRPYESNKADCQYIMLDWTSGGKTLGNKNDYSNRKSGTYYDPAFMRAREMFSDPKVAGNGHRKILIFMTDGEPNGYIDENLNYRYSDSSTERSTHIMKAVKEFEADFPNVTRYAVGISSDVDGVKGLLSDIAGSSDRFYSAKSTSEMMAALEAILDDLAPRNVSITDELSPYDALNTANTDLKITRTNRSTGNVETIWTGSSVESDGSIGSAQSGYADIIQSVQYTASQSADSTGTITVTFKPEYRVDSQYTYTVSYNVKATNAAYQYTDAHADYPNTGDADTDYGENATSSEKPGFNANKSARVNYTSSGSDWQDDYKHPVIQTHGSVTIAAPEITKTVNLNGAAPASETFVFTIQAIEPANAPLPTQTAAEWTYDGSALSGTAQFGEITFNSVGTYVYRIMETAGQNPEWRYDASAYRWTVTVTRSADNSLTATGVLTKEGAQGEADTPAERAAFMNEYASDLALTIIKSDSTDHTKRLSGAIFALYSDAACTADSLVTVYADAEKTQAMTHFTTAGENGAITVYGLKPGTYYLKESAAPGGYCLIDGALTVSVEKVGAATLPEESARIEAARDGDVPAAVVYDSPLYDIPSTGGRGAWPFHAAGLALMLLAAAAIVHRRRERGSGART